MENKGAQQAFELLLDDYHRQGGYLELVQVERVLYKLDLSPAEALRVLKRLDGHGIEFNKPGESTEEVDSEDSILGGSSNRTFGIQTLLGSAAKPLSKDEETELGRRIVLAQQTREALREGRIAPTPDTRDILERGDEARSLLVRANLLFAASVAREYQSVSSLSYEDLVQEGARGLLKAVDRFDPSRGHKFITYAVWWIRQSIQKATQEGGHLLRVPLNVGTDLSRLRKVRNRLTRLNDGRAPSLQELSDSLEWDPERVQFLLEVSSFRSQSMDKPVEPDTELTLAEVLPDSSPQPDDILTELLRREAIMDALAGMDDRDREIMIMRFGLDGEEPLTLEVIGEHFDVTRERIRQLQNRVLDRLRASRELREFHGLEPKPVEGGPTYDTEEGADED